MLLRRSSPKHRDSRSSRPQPRVDVSSVYPSVFPLFSTMSSLNENERAFIRDFLKLMSDDAVRALAATVTRRMVKVEARKACIDAIILHSTSLDEFLKRQKVTKENLFKYLNQRKISVPNTDKAALELQIKELVNGVNMPPIHTPTIQSLVKQDMVPASSWSAAEPCNSQGTMMPVTNQQGPPNTSLPELQLPSAAQLYLAATSTTRVTVEERVISRTYTQTTGINILAGMPQPDPRDSAIISEFAKWFYTRVNQPGGLVPEDFWPDANINMILKRRTDADHKAAQGGSNTSRLLNEVLEQHQLYLHPNTSSEGIWGTGKGGGLLLVLVCGTLHQRPPATFRHIGSFDIGNVLGPSLGSFENLFLLAQDPFAEDNWKIKTLEVILRSNPHISQVPTIADSELAKTMMSS